MACYSPRSGYRRVDGALIKNRGPTTRKIPVTYPCGLCIGCRLEYSRQWAMRIMHEATLHETNSFVTLTYDEENLPPDHSLDLQHWQKFAKRLRKNVGPFRFFHCGEYGDLRGRPHYHACIFGMDFRDDRYLADTNNRFHLWKSPTLTKTWGKGTECMIGSLTFDSAAYVARYCLKKIGGKKNRLISEESGLTHYERCDNTTGEITTLKPEYTTMSRNPGIGKEWIEKWMDDVYPRDFVMINGHKSNVPNYYDTQYEKKNGEKKLRQIKNERIEKGKRYEDDQTPERLATRAKVEKARIELYKRNND